MEANPENEEQQQSNAATRSEQSPRTFNYEEFQDLVLRSALGGAGLPPSFRRRLTNGSRQNSGPIPPTGPGSGSTSEATAGGQQTEDDNNSGIVLEANIDLGAALGLGAAGRRAATDAGAEGGAATPDEDAVHREAERLLGRLKGAAPFAALLLLKGLYDHLLGIVFFVFGTLLLHRINTKFCEQVANPENEKSWRFMVTALASIWIIMCLAFPIYLTEPNFWRRFLFIRKSEWNPFPDHTQSDDGTEVDGAEPVAAAAAAAAAAGPTLAYTLWAVLTNDLLARFAGLALKALRCAAPPARPCRGGGGGGGGGSGGGGWRRRPRGAVYANMDDPAEDPAAVATAAAAAAEGGGDGQGAAAGGVHGATASSATARSERRKVMGLMELAFLVYRTALPVPVWLQWYTCGGTAPDVFGVLYFFIKNFLIIHRFRVFLAGLSSYRKGELEYGAYATAETLAEAGHPDCSICFEALTKPVQLTCTHLFCEACVGQWLDKEQTCPVCRAAVSRANAIPARYRDGHTPWVPMIF